MNRRARREDNAGSLAIIMGRISSFRQVLIITVVMTLYSLFLLHSSNNFHLTPRDWSNDPEVPIHTPLLRPCFCDASSRRKMLLDPPGSVILNLSKPFRFFKSNHWFHISEYYLSRHAAVAPKIPLNGTIYILTNSDVFVEQLALMTFFLLLVAFTDGTTQRVEVLPMKALANYFYMSREVIAVDTSGVDRFVYDATLPPLERFQRVERGLHGGAHSRHAPRAVASTALHAHEAEEDDGGTDQQHSAEGGPLDWTRSDKITGHLTFAEKTDETCACGVYIGEYGSAPVERGFWFGGQTSVDNARRRIDNLCGKAYEKNRRQRRRNDPSDKSHRLVIYQRDYNRRLLDLETIEKELRRQLGDKWEVSTILHSNGHHPCFLYDALMDADMLLTPHGFQSMLLLFLPPGATIFEIFPYKYWKEGYAPLAEEWGVGYEYTMSKSVSFFRGLVLFFIPSSYCMKNIHCRKFSRGDDVILERDHLHRVVTAARAAARIKGTYITEEVEVAKLD